MDRLLPFHFLKIHTPGRTLGMADFSSCHPSHTKGQKQASKMANESNLANSIFVFLLN